ncbi:hypothetical protein BDV59DRAFT_55945 [Aspergillus ambiguus]|uniref:uncharacterized protein n=1 Tax=Aspergillus ambiguus TaxID=176160 RepID=UPI003CCD70B6
MIYDADGMEWNGTVGACGFASLCDFGEDGLGSWRWVVISASFCVFSWLSGWMIFLDSWVSCLRVMVHACQCETQISRFSLLRRGALNSRRSALRPTEPWFTPPCCLIPS